MWLSYVPNFHSDSLVLLTMTSYPTLSAAFYKQTADDRATDASASTADRVVLSGLHNSVIDTAT